MMYLILILTFVLGSFMLDTVATILNVRHISDRIPDEFKGIYEPERYAKSQAYLKENTVFQLIQSSINLVLLLAFIVFGGFNVMDLFVRGFGLNPLLTGLCFFGVLMVSVQVLSLPFSIYDTFVIEKKYGFNRTTLKTYVLDLIKGSIIGVIIGGLSFSAVLWLFGFLGSNAWVFCWIFLVIFQILLMWIGPVLIMPLFNKFDPLEEGELRTAIETYAHAQKFPLKGIYKMDGSKRSSKTNAFFTGFGKSRRIVLFDTLIEKHSVPELLSIIAHEMGHYKHKHIFKMMSFSIINTGIMFLLLSLFLNNPGLFSAFKMENVSIYASLIFFGFLYAPMSLVLGILGSYLSRAHEYEADKYAVDTMGSAEAMVSALKNLSIENLSNLTPHPFKVWLEYSHPPVLERIRACKAFKKNLI